ncbi:hypothetical protein P691DRAFT_785472 [Macrolepiota fuliginosa MF-IS2]|uniref:Uncharacterized protein n=1 Tax=Macrolepiota fuliginosa MF-IS2 TaxID=1400762 RepID=A0A9P5WYJ9_9AGAR|nr:hypothetical protein P691DRAFT_785472 [Macrolepiota fuliginosa MF-IS2]
MALIHPFSPSYSSSIPSLRPNLAPVPNYPRWSCNSQGSTGQAWKDVLQQVQCQWKIYHELSVIVILTTICHFLIPVEGCTWSHYFAAIALMSGTMNLAFTTVYKEYFKILQQPFVFNCVSKAFIDMLFVILILQDIKYTGLVNK